MGLLTEELGQAVVLPGVGSHRCLDPSGDNPCVSGDTRPFLLAQPIGYTLQRLIPSCLGPLLVLVPVFFLTPRDV